jgi:hypothetical protein
VITTAVVFLGAAGGGPSADCCCDYLNFFTDEAAARAWMLAHPHIPGQILGQADTQALGGAAARATACRQVTLAPAADWARRSQR